MAHTHNGMGVVAKRAFPGGVYTISRMRNSSAAIPAVVIYNHLTRSISAHRALLGDASAMVLLLISREGDRGSFHLARAAE